MTKDEDKALRSLYRDIDPKIVADIARLVSSRHSDGSQYTAGDVLAHVIRKRGRE